MELLDRIRAQVLGPKFPRTEQVDAFGEPVTFEVTNSTEAWRATQFGHEEAFLEPLFDSIEPGDVVFDVGACIGLVTLNAAQRGARVFAFEPSPGYRSRLRRNLCLNDLDATVLPWAIADEAGETTLFTDGVDGNSPSLVEDPQRGATTVETRSLDGIVASGGFPAPDVVKIDIEGAEILALRGMQTLLASEDRPREIYLETHPAEIEAFGATEDEVLDLVMRHGYELRFQSPRREQAHYRFEAPDPTSAAADRGARRSERATSLSS